MWTLIQRYICGETTRHEARAVEQWMKKDEANQQIVKDLTQIWKLTPEEDFELNVEEAWSRFREKKMPKKVPDTLSTKISGKRGSMKTLLRVAAVLLLGAFVGFFSWQYGKKRSKGEKKKTYAMQKLVTKNGEKAQVTFSDGTSVTLNVASSLRFPKAFAGAKREVYLNGEAYFNVAHNKDKPFIVHTLTTDIKVFGTKFNVQAWQEDQQAVVGVQQGKVMVNLTGSRQKNDGVLLTKGEYTTIDEGQLSPVKHGNVHNFMLWMGGGLYFNDAPFSTVIRQLERKFNVQISINDPSVMNVPFTGTFKNADLKEVVAVISTSMGFDYTLNKSGVVFSETK